MMTRTYPVLKQNMEQSSGKHSLLRDFGRFTNIEGINNAGRAATRWGEISG